MPEGVKSIDELKVVIDASTTTFTSNLNQARSLLSQFAGDGGSLISSFDASFGKLGPIADLLKGRFASLVPILGQLSTAIDLFSIGLDKLASATGETEGLAELKKEAGELGKAIGGALTFAMNGFGSASGQAASEVGDVVDALTGISTSAAGVQAVAAAASDAKASIGAITEEAEDAGDATIEAAGEIARGLHQVATEAKGAGVELDATSGSVQALGSAGTEAEAKVSRMGAALAMLTGIVKTVHGELLRGLPVDGNSLTELDRRIDYAQSRLDRAQQVLASMERQHAGTEKPLFDGAVPFDAKDIAATTAAIGQMAASLKNLQDARAKLTEWKEFNGGGSFEITAMIDALAKQRRGLELEIELQGKSAEASAGLRAEKQLLMNLDERNLAIRRALETETIAKGRKDGKSDDAIRAELEGEAFAKALAARQVYMSGDHAAKVIEEANAIAGLVQQKNNWTEVEKDLARQRAEQDRQSATIDRVSDGIDNEIEALHRKIEAVDGDARAVAEAAYVEKQMLALRQAGIEITDEDVDSIHRRAGAYVEAAFALESLLRQQKEQERAEAGIDKTGASMDAEIEALERKIAAINGNARAASEAAFVEKHLNALTSQGIEASAADIEVIHNQARAYGTLTVAVTAAQHAAKDRDRQAGNRDRQEEGVGSWSDDAERDLALLQRKATALQQTAGELAEAEFFERHYQAAQRKGLEVTEDEIDALRVLAGVAGQAATAKERAAQQMQALADHGRIVSSSLENAFSSWAKGGEINVRQMVSNMIAEFARLALVKSFLNPLFGGGDTKGGGIFGDVLSGLFGGLRAEGGPVDGARAYIVGERGPELFMPGQSGHIVPNHKLGGGGNTTTIALNIDARGATADAVAALREQMPEIVMSTVRSAQERGAL